MTSFCCYMKWSRVSNFVACWNGCFFVEPCQFFNNWNRTLCCCNVRTCVTILREETIMCIQLSIDKINIIPNEIFNSLDHFELTLVTMKTEFGFCSKSSLTASGLFDFAAIWMGFCPSSSVQSKLAPRSRSMLTTAFCPADAARCRGVCFFYCK